MKNRNIINDQTYYKIDYDILKRRWDLKDAKIILGDGAKMQTKVKGKMIF